MILLAGVFASALVFQATPVEPDTATGTRLRVFPAGSYSGVTGLQYGAAMLVGFRVGPDSSTRPSSFTAYGALTAKGHAKGYLQVDRWSAGNERHARARLEHISYPLPYFGIGPRTPASAEEWYSSGVTTIHLFVQQAIPKPRYWHWGVRSVWTRLHDTEPGGAIDRGDAPGAGGTHTTALEIGPVIDSRDDMAAPGTGVFTRAILSGGASTGDETFGRLAIDARRYAPVGAGHVVALQLQYDGLFGSLPFDQLPMIGADTAMRGYPRGRFRDRQAMTAQVELRTAYWRRIGAVAFAGAGTVAPVFGRLASGTWYPTAGIGLRALLSPRQRAIGRLDLAFGRGSWGVNVGLGEAF